MKKNSVTCIFSPNYFPQKAFLLTNVKSKNQMGSLMQNVVPFPISDFFTKICP
ncbi:MAG: hypothetical protein RL757_3266, partial [Bacteroidota bacterium]